MNRRPLVRLHRFKFARCQNFLTYKMEQSITTLNISKDKINKLQSIGIHYYNDLTESPFPLDLGPIPTSISALQLLEIELLNGCILSYNAELDKVLTDEISPKRVTELAGHPGSGKTQICFQLSITSQLPEDVGGLQGQVIYINTNKNFASHRLRELSKKFIAEIIDKIGVNASFTEESVLKNIFVFNISQVGEIYAAVRYLKIFLKDKKVKLLIIDSFANLLRDVESKERTAVTYRLLEDLQNLATNFNFAIVITNDFTTRVKDNQTYQTPSFGDSFFDRVNTRICLSKSDNFYVAELTKSPIKPPTIKVNYCMF